MGRSALARDSGLTGLRRVEQKEELNVQEAVELIVGVSAFFLLRLDVTIRWSFDPPLTPE